MVLGREACKHYSVLPTPTSGGEPGGFLSEMMGIGDGGFFFNHSFSISVFRL